MLSFVNDYSEGCHEKILEKLVETNRETLGVYGEDKYSLSAKEKINSELTSKQNEILSHIEKIRSQDAEISSLKDQISKLKEEKEDIQTKIEIDKTLNQNNEANEIANLTSQLEYKEKINNDLKEENDKLRKEKTKIEDDLAMLQSQKECSFEFSKGSERRLKDEILNQIANIVLNINYSEPNKQYLQIYKLRYDKGMTQKEISEELSLSQSEVSKRLFNLMEKVRQSFR